MPNYSVGAGGISLPNTTAPEATGTAMGLGNEVYNQLPGYSSSVSNVGGNINAETGGQLPADVVRQIQQSAAERGIATGTSGSAANNASYLRDIGLNSLQLTNMGESNLNAELPNLPGAAISQNPGFYETPGQYLGATEASANLSNKQQQQQLAQANNERGLALARQGLAAGAAGAGVGSFTIPGDNSAATDASWWNQPSYAPNPTVYGPGGGPNASPVDQILAKYPPGGADSGGNPWNQTDESATGENANSLNAIGEGVTVGG